MRRQERVRVDRHRRPDRGRDAALAECYDLHPLAVEDAIKADQLPKIDVYDDQLFVVARTARMMEDHIDYGETAIFVGHSHIISVRHGSTRAHTALREQLESSPRLLMHGVDYLLHAILDYIVDGYLPLIEDLEEEVLEMETKAIDSFLDRDEVNRIFTVRRELIRFQRVLGPMGEVAQKLARQELPCIDAAARVYFRDVQDHVHSGPRRGSTAGAKCWPACSNSRPCSSSSGRERSRGSWRPGRRSWRCRPRSPESTA